MNSREIRRELARLNGWRLRDKHIWRTFIFDDFAGSMKFVNRVAKQAESMNHHPDILIQYSKVKLTLTTHDEGGLTMKDFKLAGRVDKVAKRARA